MYLNREEILNHKIKIEPFEEDLLKEDCYHVRLGNFYYRSRKEKFFSDNIINPYSDESKWEGPFISKPLTDGFKFKNISPQDEFILIHPRETILVHTIEYIGVDEVGFKVKRLKEFNFLTIKLCSNQDFNRITLELHNNSDLTIILVVNKPIAQVLFYPSKIKRNIENYKVWSCSGMIE